MLMLGTSVQWKGFESLKNLVQLAKIVPLQIWVSDELVYSSTRPCVLLSLCCQCKWGLC